MKENSKSKEIDPYLESEVMLTTKSNKKERNKSEDLQKKLIDSIFLTSDPELPIMRERIRNLEKCPKKIIVLSVEDQFKFVLEELAPRQIDGLFFEQYPGKVFVELENIEDLPQEFQSFAEILDFPTFLRIFTLNSSPLYEKIGKKKPLMLARLNTFGYYGDLCQVLDVDIETKVAIVRCWPRRVTFDSYKTPHYSDPEPFNHRHIPDSEKKNCLVKIGFENEYIPGIEWNGQRYISSFIIMKVYFKNLIVWDIDYTTREERVFSKDIRRVLSHCNFDEDLNYYDNNSPVLGLENPFLVKNENKAKPIPFENKESIIEEDSSSDDPVIIEEDKEVPKQEKKKKNTVSTKKEESTIVKNEVKKDGAAKVKQNVQQFGQTASFAPKGKEVVKQYSFPGRIPIINNPDEKISMTKYNPAVHTHVQLKIPRLPHVNTPKDDPDAEIVNKHSVKYEFDLNTRRHTSSRNKKKRMTNEEIEAILDDATPQTTTEEYDAKKELKERRKKEKLEEERRIKEQKRITNITKQKALIQPKITQNKEEKLDTSKSEEQKSNDVIEVKSKVKEIPESKPINYQKKKVERVSIVDKEKDEQVPIHELEDEKISLSEERILSKLSSSLSKVISSQLASFKQELFDEYDNRYQQKKMQKKLEKEREEASKPIEFAKDKIVYTKEDSKKKLPFKMIEKRDNGDILVMPLNIFLTIPSNKLVDRKE